ncbi:hypothetical protein FXW05_11905 [Staphylococcus pseudintermedius]|uniref:stage II sporulation protein M n=2 Tax=Staphylococcus pseudintermedius TaxID=283734 RepID=UPI00102F79A0|nr:stage II sporulation protein M [Staphylococcus pseudintermedius]EGQ3093376.1 hypothetical protein [Staphylococcus pseudintermedius]EGQ3321187.1 hypothetical protein [Staphylococcus pseudintermedius]EGQ3537519.1 hypothetical protein [Staphylococcus pseudintermedius]EGQ3637928.1 hypothetical protein [Staphylococcus pseudintermedius]EGQ3659615.1 hypothetical protein [Staphylococcus pseudintermedius]
MSFKMYILSFLALYLVFFTLGYYFEPSVSSATVAKPLSYRDIFYIFMINSLIIFFIFILCPTGISLIIIFKNVFSIGQSIQSSGEEFYMYFSISLIHGIFEITALFFAYKLTIDFFTIYLKPGFFRSKSFKGMLINLFSVYLIYILPLLLIGAIFEVLVSNRLLISYQ